MRWVIGQLIGMNLVCDSLVSIIPSVISGQCLFIFEAEFRIVVEILCGR